MNFKTLPLEALVPSEYNPRKKLKPGDPEFEQIKKSILSFGIVDPIIVGSDMTIIGGHQRAEVLKHLGYKEADCVVVDLDKAKEKALNIALSNIVGEWDKGLLADWIHDLLASKFDVSLTGFDPKEFENGDKTKEDAFNLDQELRGPTMSRAGDVWQLGRMDGKSPSPCGRSRPNVRRLSTATREPRGYKPKRTCTRSWTTVSASRRWSTS